VTGLGIVGCGWVTATRHLPALVRVRDLDVVALADVDHEAVEALATQFGVPGRYGGIAQLLDDPRVDAVAVCVPPSAHVEVALAGLAAGKHVFVEKPLALTLEDAGRLVERAAGTGLTTMAGFNLRFHRLVLRLRDRVAAGELGSIHALGTTYTDDVLLRPDLAAWRTARGRGGGTLLEKAIHHFDLWRFLLADEVEDVHAYTGSGRATDEVACVSARMRGGALATALALDATSPSNEVAVYGTKARATLDLYRFDGLAQASLTEPPGAARTRARALLRTARTLPAGLGAARRGGEAMLAYEAEWRHFGASIALGGAVESTLEDGLHALEIAIATLESAATGERVSVRSR
jgi:myo-inositol 2-dehydrogenase / D-chiro-inositol 1-dehydrogenase